MFRIGFIEPHLDRYGGIRRVIELGNALVEAGHDVTYYVPDGQPLLCSWMKCRGAVTTLAQGFVDPPDVILFNHEPQWHIVGRFRDVGARIFYALHYSKLYQKEGSWESIRAPVDLQLANSAWTAAMIEAETGQRPIVLSGGINNEHFHPVPVPKRYPLLCVGDSRPWKGTETIKEAAKLVGVPLEAYADKDLPQEMLAEEYASAEVFVVGSEFEGFCQPGLEAMACGVPLVTTDNGGCGEYAHDGQTALVVPPNDPYAMAEAIQRLRREPELAMRLVKNGLELIQRDFSWERSAAQFIELVEGALDGQYTEWRSSQPNQRGQVAEPLLSIVVLQWDQLLHTQRCVESIRQNTDVPYELIIVDNGSSWEAASYAEAAADTPVINLLNRGFAAGMNQGLSAARGEYVVFLNNDTRVPKKWASELLEGFAKYPQAGIVVPSVTAAGNPRTVVDEPGEGWETIMPFEAPPSGVVYVMRTEIARELGGWGEEYLVASAEDVDLAFKVWVNELEVVWDQRVLIDHVGHATSDSKLENREALWHENRERFLAKWTDIESPVPRLRGCPEDVFTRNRGTASCVAGWMGQYFRTRERMRNLEARMRQGRRSEPTKLPAPASSSPTTRDQESEVVVTDSGAGGTPLRLGRHRGLKVVGRKMARLGWKLVRPLVPASWRLRLFRRYRGSYYELFPERAPEGLRND